MCGIWALFGVKCSSKHFECFSAIKHRGPDAWRLELDAREPNMLLGFHRLVILDGLYGMQPMRLHRYPRTTLICNGEIYNYKRLQEQHNFPYETKCDVEAIIHLYHNFGIASTVRQLDGVFAFCLVDAEKKKIYIARDPYGVRPLFSMEDIEDGILGVSSEAKGLVTLKSNENSTLGHFLPGHYQVWNMLKEGKVKLDHTEQFFKPGMPLEFQPSIKEEVLSKLNNYEKTAYLFEAACTKRLMTERKIGCLLSGGLDSSLVTSLVVKHAKENNLPKIRTFSIGMGDSPDLIAARKVSEYLDTEHHEVRFDENDVRRALDKVIYHLESFDITNIRCSVPMFILAEYIKKNTDSTVIFTGEGADELAQGYIYFRDAPSPQEAHDESVRLLSDIYLYDGLRTDRTASAFGLELRFPFLDIQFTSHYLSIDPKLRQPQDNVEKHFLRSSFANSGLLPDSILWRHKEALEDGVTSLKKSFYTILSEIISEIMPEDTTVYNGTQPTSTESRYYRYVFEKTFPKQQNFTPYYWMPKWIQVSDPSARFISHYAAK